MRAFFQFTPQATEDLDIIWWFGLAAGAPAETVRPRSRLYFVKAFLVNVNKTSQSLKLKELDIRGRVLCSPHRPGLLCFISFGICHTTCHVKNPIRNHSGAHIPVVSGDVLGE